MSWDEWVDMMDWAAYDDNGDPVEFDADVVCQELYDPIRGDKQFDAASWQRTFNDIQALPVTS